MSEVKYEYTKTPLDYQITEYDCGATSLLNALRYLFKRSEISPEIYKYIMQYTLDRMGEDGEIGKGGTSIYALDFLTNWLNENAESKNMKLRCESIPKNEISIYNKDIENYINNGGVAILRVYQACEHYCLLTKLDDEFAYVFDPYYLNINYYNSDPDIKIIKDRPFEYNRKIKKTRFEEETNLDFSLVKNDNAQIILIERIDK